MKPSLLLNVMMLATAGCAISTPVFAQSLEQLKPRAVPPQVSLPPAPPAKRAATANIKVGLLRGEKVLLPKLIGVAFYANPGAARRASPGNGVTIAGVPQLKNQALYRIADFFLDAPISKPGLDRLVESVRLYLSEIGYPFSVVYLPPQDITSGIVRLVVTVSHLQGRVEVEGAHYFSAAQYRSAIRVKPGEPVNRQQLQADIDWINRNPFRAARVTAVAGTAPATTRILLHVKDRNPWRFFAGADNTGTTTTRRDHVTTGFNWGNAFGRGDIMSLQWNSSWNFHTFTSASGSYQMFLPSRRILTFSGAWSHTNGVVAPPFTLTGKSWQVSADYDIPSVEPLSRISHSWDFGVDVKETNNNFEFSTIPISNNLTQVIQARVTWSGSLISANGNSTTWDATVTAAPGNLTSRNQNKYFNISRAGAQADYIYFRGGASHRAELNGIARGLAWSVRGRMQIANHNLIGSEQFQGSGMYAVRGYAENVAYDDNGVLLSQTLHLPAWRLNGFGRLQAYVFEDYAHLWSTDALPGEVPINLHSVGMGVDYVFGRYVSMRADYGWQLHRTGIASTGRHSRFDFTATVSY